MDAVSKLKAAIDRALSVTFEPLYVQAAMNEELEALRKLLKSAGGNSPPRDRLREAVLFFRANGELPNLAIARAVCFGAAERFDHREPPLIEESDKFPRLLGLVDDYQPEPRCFRRCYRGLLHAYIAYDGEHRETCKAGRQNWARLRDYLHDRRQAIVSEGAQPEWAECIAQHPNLLTEEPASRYAAELLQDRKQVVEEIRSRLDVGDQSWLMRKLILAQIVAATRESDVSYGRLVQSLLDLLDGHDVLEDEGLTLILNRYASIRGPDLHVGLRDRAVTSWGNPWIERNVAKWALASKEARALVIGWFKLHVIRTFFELLSEDGRTDQRRVKFWEQYYEQIGDMYFALGSTTMYSRSTDAKQMRKEMGDRLLGLRNAGASSNNAFIMMIGDLVAVEFGVTGHACFLYRRDSLPFELRGEVSGSTAHDGLRSSDHLERLTHVDTRHGKWEENFADVLRRHGAARATRPQAGVRAAPPPRGASLNRRALQEFCESNGIAWQDNSPRGGNLAVRFPYNAGVVANQLKAWGFTYSDQREIWWRKDWP